MTSQPEPYNLNSEDLTGRRLGEYQLLRRLGQGGMSNVYLARQKSLQRKVAIKILKSDLAKDETYVRRFAREAQAAAKLVQANIVQIFEVGHIDGFHFIAQEYVAGRNLGQYIGRHGAVEPVMAVNVLRQCSKALQTANESGVVHRDIKPENIMLSTKGEVKITDFGLARILDRRSDQELTQVGITMGTPLYMSPEQVGGQKLDHRSDIYSLGITAYHMLAGAPPFDGENALTVAVQHINDNAKALKSIRPDVPPELIDIIESMIRKKPEDRPQDAKQLLKLLRKIKIDDVDDWEMIVERLSTTDASIMLSDTSTWSQSQLAATRQLQQVIQNHSKSRWRSPWLWLSAITIVVGSAFGGAFFATAQPYQSLLNIDNFDDQKIPKKQTVQDQYEAARRVPLLNQKEKYFLSVMEYFPVDQADPENEKRTLLYHRYAKQRLSELYLSQDRYDDALALFEEFTGYEDLEEPLQVTGYAGIAIVLDAMRAEDFSGTDFERQQELTEAVNRVLDREDMLNQFMQERFEKVSDRNSLESPF
jgi:serine/threonine-protein kinase